MRSESSKEFKVAIIGAGMGGLALAVGLIRGGIKVDIYEQASKFSEIGAGVGLGINAIRALHGLGILDDILVKVEEPLVPRAILFVSGLPGHEIIYDYPSENTDRAMGVHRAHFLDALVKLLPLDAIHFNKRCTSVVQSDSKGVAITFSDSTTNNADIVIGCDGIRSMVRSSVMGKTVEAKFTKTVAYRGLVSEEKAVAALGELILRRPISYVGHDNHLICFPLQNRHTTNVVVFCTDRSRPVEEQAPGTGEPWAVQATRAEMLEHFVGWGPNVLNLLGNIEKPSKWFLHALDPPLTSYVRGKVALLGDAAHSMLPHLGAGAGQAIEDALLLTQLLTHPSTNMSNAEIVLQAYDMIRRPRANTVLTASYAAGEIYEFAGPSGPTVEGVRKDLEGIWEFVWRHDLDEDIRTAIKFLEDKQAFKADVDV